MLFDSLLFFSRFFFSTGGANNYIRVYTKILFSLSCILCVLFIGELWIGLAATLEYPQKRSIHAIDAFLPPPGNPSLETWPCRRARRLANMINTQLNPLKAERLQSVETADATAPRAHNEMSWIHLLFKNLLSLRQRRNCLVLSRVWEQRT